MISRHSVQVRARMDTARPRAVLLRDADVMLEPIDVPVVGG